MGFLPNVKVSIPVVTSVFFENHLVVDSDELFAYLTKKKEKTMTYTL